MNDLYDSLAAWSGGMRRSIGRTTTLRGAPTSTVRVRAELARRLAAIPAADAGPWERPHPPSEPASAVVRTPRRPLVTLEEPLARRAG